MKALSLQSPRHWGPFRKALNLVLVATLTLGAVTLPEAWAADYYVNSTTGSDANGGSSAAPWRTLTHALDSSASGVTSGDVIHVAAGTYDAGNGETFPLALADGVAIIGDTTTPSNCVISAPAGENAFYNDDSTSPAGLSSATRLAGCTLEHDAASGTPLMEFAVGAQAMSPRIDHNNFAGTTTSDDGIDYYDASTASSTFTPTIDGNSFTDLRLGIGLTSLNKGASQIFSPTVTNNTFSGCNYPLDYSMIGTAEGTVGGTVQGNTFRNTAWNDVYGWLGPHGSGSKIIFNTSFTGNDMQSGAQINFYEDVEGSGYSGDVEYAPTISHNSMDGWANNIYAYIYYSVDGNYTFAPTMSGNTMTGASGQPPVYLSALQLSVSTPTERNVFSPTVMENNITAGGSDGVEVSISRWKAGQIEGTANISGNDISGADSGINWTMSEMMGDGMDWSVDLSNNTITSPADYGVYFSMSSMSFSSADGGALNVTADGNTVTGAGNVGIELYPAWDFGPNNEIAETVLVRGNTVTGSSWNGLEVDLSGQTSNSLDARIADNVLQSNSGNGLYLISSDLGSNGIQVSCNSITGNSRNGIDQDNGSDPPADFGGGGLSSVGNNVLMNNNTSSGSYFDVLNQEATTAAAQHNWWGSASGPGAGQTSGPIDTSSFLTAAPTVNVSSTLTATVANDVAPSGPSVGDTLLYTAVIHSNGTCGDASATFTATVDSNTTVVPSSLTTTLGNVKSEDPPTVALGHLGAGDSATVTWEVMVNGGTSVESQGTVTATRSGSTLTDDPATATSIDATVTSIQPQPQAFPIPTLGGWALLALSALLLLLGVVLMRRRQRLGAPS